MTSLPETASAYFGSMVAEYDSLIRRAVPRYDEMIDRLIDYLPDATRIVELGCGTGNLSLQLTKRFPTASFTFVDASPEMLAVTRDRIAVPRGDVAERSAFIEARFEELDLPADSFDLVVSSISLHHVDDKLPVYRNVFRILRGGGTFRFSDQLRGNTEANHEKNWTRWLEFCREPGHCSEEEVQSLLDHAEAHDHYTPLVQHFEMLRAAGFASLDCVWRNWIWGIVTAEKR